MASAVSRFVRHFIVLFKKNMLQKLRKPFTTIIELSFPFQAILIMYLIMYLTGQAPSSSSQQQVIVDAPLNKLPPRDNPFSTIGKPISYSAISEASFNLIAKPFIEQLSRDVRLGQVKLEHLEKKDFVQRYKEYYGNLHFRDKDLLLVNKSMHFSSLGLNSQSNQTSQFLQSGFIEFLNILQENFMKYKYPTSNVKLNLQFKEFPIKSSFSIFGFVFQLMFPLYFCMSAVTLSSPFVISMISEKKAKLKSALQMMGCNMVAYNFSWWSVMAIEVIINSVTMTLLLAITGLLKSNLLIFFVAYNLFLFSIIPLTSITSSLFQEPKTASIVSNIIYMVFVFAWYMIRFITTLASYNSYFERAQYIFNLFSPFAFAEFAYYFCSVNEPMTLSALFSGKFSSPYNVPLGLCYMAFDMVLYQVLTIYFEKVIPGEFSRASHPLFCCMPSFWKRLFKPSQKINVLQQHVEEATVVEMMDNEAHVQQEEEAATTIELNQISKVFSKGIIQRTTTTAVENLSLKIKQGEIFALLGHNGAGKTTTISMITGCIKPTFGSATIHGLSIDDELDIIRQNMGVCWQEDVIFDKLTCWEHLQLFATIKDVPRSEINNEIEQRLQSVGLEEDKNRYVTDFSGGMKRKLSLSLALIGDSSIIVLDEPTTGMDAVSRRKVWSVLQDCKKHKTILLTTHSMEEADLLADTIAIMKKGKLEVAGNALSLKNHYGVGYTLHCILQQATEGETTQYAADPSVEDKITNYVKSFIPNCTRQEDTSIMNRRTNELFLVLPYQSVSLFPNFLREFEKNLAQLGIASYGLSITTLEEVFLKINADVLDSENQS